MKYENRFLVNLHFIRSIVLWDLSPKEQKDKIRHLDVKKENHVIKKGFALESENIFNN